jgi:putative phage-type endonuclease
METTIAHGTDAWRERRYDSVTGTEVAIIIGLNKDTSKMALMCLKAKREEAVFNPFTRSLMDNGKLFEPAARACYERQFGVAGRVPKLWVHSEEPYFAGSPDLVFDKDKLLVEIKTHFYPAPEMSEPIASISQIPLKYYIQVQAYLEITGWEEGHLFSWTQFHGSRTFGIRRDPHLFQVIFPELKKFVKALEEVRRVGLDSEEGARIIRAQRMEKGGKDYWSDLVWDSMKNHTLLIK